MNLSATFSKLTEDERQRLVDAGTVIKFSTGEAIISEKEVVQSILLIKSGFVRVTRTYLDDLTAEFAGPLGPGEIVGEMSLLDGVGAIANLIADGPTEVLSIPRGVIDKMLAEDDGFAARFFHSLFLELSRKLRSTNQRVLPVPP